MKRFFVILLLFFVVFSFYAKEKKQVVISVNGKRIGITTIMKRNMPFVSSREICNALGGHFYFNPKNMKLELKFNSGKLKFTARNQFVVQTIKNIVSVFQLPLSTLQIKNDVFIPLLYSKKYLTAASNKYFNIELSDKHNEIIATIASEPISEFDIFSLQTEEKFNGTQLVFNTTKPVYKFSRSIINNQLIITIASAKIDPHILDNFKPTGFIKSAELIPLNRGTYQFTFKLKSGYAGADIFYDEESSSLLVSIQNKSVQPKEINFADEISRWQFDAIVIDAGHGGKDPGARGVTGINEKDINLSIALKLGKLVEKYLPSVKVYYTRTTDKFVELYKRGKFANDVNGKLFISIHCNSLRKKPSKTRGFETYLLRPGKTDDAIKIAEYENSVIELEDNPHKYQTLTNENFILVSMAHAAYMRYSEKFSEILTQKLSSRISIPSRGIKQAGFYVLVGASMPGILFETGFLSNKKDEAYLKSKSGQNKIASAMFEAIKSYKSYYENAIKSEL